jgi:hypothetical protein
MKAAAMHVAMAMIPPLSLSGKTPRVSIARPAPRAILITIEAIASSPSHANLGYCPYRFPVALPRIRSARIANGPKTNVVSSHALVDLPRLRAMWRASGIKAIEVS